MNGVDHPTPLEVLRGARELLADARHWIQGADAFDASGTELVNGYEDGATCWCLVGALEKVSGRTMATYHEPAYRIIDDLIDPDMGGDPREWNDAPERTHSDILALLDKAISTAEAAHV